jgi:hypothetical protein
MIDPHVEQGGASTWFIYAANSEFFSVYLEGFVLCV